MVYPARIYRADPFEILRKGLSGLPAARVSSAAAFPKLNIWRTRQGAAIVAEMPGINPQKVNITVKENLLSISGERAQPDCGNDARWMRRERSYGQFTRAVTLPFRIDPENVEARYSNGILFIAAGLSDADKPRKIAIKAG